MSDPMAFVSYQKTLESIPGTLGYGLGTDIKMIVSSHTTKMAGDVKHAMGSAAQKHGVLFVSMGQVQGIVMSQVSSTGNSAHS